MPSTTPTSQLSSQLAALQVAAAAAAAAAADDDDNDEQNATLSTSFNEFEWRRRIFTANAESISQLLAPAVTSQITWYNCRTTMDTVM